MCCEEKEQLSVVVRSHFDFDSLLASVHTLRRVRCILVFDYATNNMVVTGKRINAFRRVMEVFLGPAGV
jgi:hypothetical protein